MPRTGSGPFPKNRAWCLIQALFEQSRLEETELLTPFKSIRIKKCDWDSKDYIHFEVDKATLPNLMELIIKRKSTEYQNLAIEPENIRVILNDSLNRENDKSPLPILIDLKNDVQKKQRDSSIRHFKVYLWGKTLDENKEGFEREWGHPELTRSRLLAAYRAADNQHGNNDTESSNKTNDRAKPDKYLNPTQHIPKGVSKFIGRKDVLVKLHRIFQENTDAPVTAISGMGGLGKTELAIRYARDNEANYLGGMCWINARNTNLSSELIEFVERKLNFDIPKTRGEKPLSIQEQVEWCWEHWKPAEGLVLIILDDVTDLESFADMRPKANRFHVLMTTRVRNLSPNNIQEIPLEVLSHDEALKLLGVILGEKDKRVEDEPQAAQDLCEWLGYLPLGLQLVAQFLVRKPIKSLATMLESLNAERLRNDAINPSKAKLKKSLNTAQYGVYEAFEITWREFESPTQNVGRLLSLFKSNDFLWEWVENANERLSWSNSDLETANEDLYGYNLIHKVEEGVNLYNIHSLVGEFLQAELFDDSKREEIERAFAAIMLEIAYNIHKTQISFDSLNLRKVAVPHLISITQNLTSTVNNQDLLSIYLIVGKFYLSIGLLNNAEKWWNQCLFVQKQLNDNEDSIVIFSNCLAEAYASQGRYTQAEALLQDSLKVLKHLYGDEQLSVAIVKKNLGKVYELQGKYNEAESLFQQALELKKYLLGEDNIQIAEILRDLAGIYKEKGYYAEAEPLYMQALELTKRFLGDEDQSVAANLNGLALLYISQTRYDEAQPLLHQSLKINKQIFGEENFRLAVIYNNLASVYNSQARYTEAESVLRQSLKLVQRELGDIHPYIANILNNLAFICSIQGRYTEAEPLYLQTLEQLKRLLGNEHPNIASSLNNLASLYTLQGRYAEAETLVVQALELRKRLLGNEHPDVATSLNNLAEIYKLQGHYAKAEPIYQESLEHKKRLFGDEHPHIATIVSNLAELYESQGCYEKAEPLYQQALELRKRLLGNEHPDVATSLNNLALNYSLQGRYTEAKPLYLQALVHLKDVFGDEHPDVATVFNNLAELYKLQGFYEEAERLYLQALELRKRLLGIKHPNVAFSINKLATLYELQGRFTEAESISQQI